MLDTNEKLKSILDKEKKQKNASPDQKEGLVNLINLIVSAAQLVLMYFGYNVLATKFGWTLFTAGEYTLTILGALSFLTLLRNFIKGFYKKYDKK